MIKIKICDANPQGACSYYRSVGPFSKLRYIDDSIRVEYLTQVGWNTLIDTDILVLQRPVDDTFLSSIELAKNMGVKIWVDFDDCLHMIPKDNPFYIEMKKHPEYSKNSVKAMMLADIVTVSTEAIKQAYQKCNNNIIVIPNAWNDYDYPFNLIENQTPDFISWRGSPTHRQDLLSVKQDIVNIEKKYKKLCWSFVGDDTWYITDALKNCHAMAEVDLVSYYKYISTLHSAIHIVPLVFNEFNKCKSNIAWIEATYSGSAVLAPDMPEFNQPGITNYKEDKFEYWLDRLLMNKNLQKENYKESYNYIKNNLLLSTINQLRLDCVYSVLKKEKTIQEKNIVTAKVEKVSKIIFPDMLLAHQYCHGRGIELGAAAHNPFNLENCVNVAPKEDEEFFKQSQIKTCGTYIPITKYGDAKHIPYDNNLFDYIISSHVVEHVPDLIGAFFEWNRVLKPGGIIFMIFPKRNALESDIGREVSTIDDFEYGHKNPNRKLNNDLHVWIFTLDSMIALIDYCNASYDLRWKIIKTEETDSKVGNGHTVVCQRKKII